MRTLVFLASLSLAACAAKTPDGRIPSPEPHYQPPDDETPAPAASARDEDAAAPVAEPSPAPEPAATKPTLARGTIGGESLSTVSVEQVEAALKKLGWAAPKHLPPSGAESKGRESHTFTLEKRHASAEVMLVRPVPGQTPAPDSRVKDASTTAAEHPDAASYVEGEVAVVVTVKGKRHEAEKLLDQLVQK